MCALTDESKKTKRLNKIKKIEIMKGFLKVSETKSGQENILNLKSMIVDAKSGIRVEIDCPKCNGYGGIDHFAHVQNGICFLCKGTKKTFSYNCPEQRNTNRILKERIAELESSYYVTAELIKEFCNIKEHQTVWFSEVSEKWFYNKLRETGLPFGKIINDYNHLINCNKNFMYE